MDSSNNSKLKTNLIIENALISKLLRSSYFNQKRGKAGNILNYQVRMVLRINLTVMTFGRTCFFFFDTFKSKISDRRWSISLDCFNCSNFHCRIKVEVFFMTIRITNTFCLQNSNTLSNVKFFCWLTLLKAFESSNVGLQWYWNKRVSRHWRLIQINELFVSANNVFLRSTFPFDESIESINKYKYNKVWSYIAE